MPSLRCYSASSIPFFLSLCSFPCVSSFAQSPSHPPYAPRGRRVSISPMLMMGSTPWNCIPGHRGRAGQLHPGGSIPSCAPPCHAALNVHPSVGSQLGHPKGSTCWGWSSGARLWASSGLFLKQQATDRTSGSSNMNPAGKMKSRNSP